MPIAPASEGARNISVRGSQEYSQTRELRTNQQSKSKETKKNHQVIKSSEDIIESQRPRATPRETQIIRPIAIESSEDLSQGSRTRFFFLQEPDSTDTKTRSNLEGIQPFYSSNRASRGLVCSICEAYFLFRPAVKQRERSRRSSAEKTR